MKLFEICVNSSQNSNKWAECVTLEHMHSFDVEHRLTSYCTLAFRVKMLNALLPDNGICPLIKPER